MSARTANRAEKTREQPANRPLLQVRTAASREPLFAVERMPASVRRALNTPGHPLEEGTRDLMEGRLGHDFSHVRVHADARAGDSAQEVQAQTYTVGHHVVFGAGRYETGTREGLGLLAHELAHVVEHDKHQIPPGVLQRRGLLESVEIFLGLTEGEFDEAELRQYLDKVSGESKIEDKYDSDNKARAIVREWKKGNARFNLTPHEKIMLIREMQSGYTGDDDERAILDLLENSDNGDLRQIFAPGGIVVQDLNDDFQGKEWKELQAFYEQRFEGGMEALLRGTVVPKGAPPAGAPSFPYSWTILKGKIYGPVRSAEVLDYLNALSSDEREQAMQDLQQERIRQDLEVKALAEQADAAKDQKEQDKLKAANELQSRYLYKIDLVLQSLYLQVAVAEPPAVLARGTKIPTAQEKAQIRDALKAPGKADLSGTALPFQSRLKGESESYEDKVRKYVPQMVDKAYKDLVVGKGPAEHAKGHTPEEIVGISKASKKQTDAVFGSYKTGPEFKADKPAKGGKPAEKGNIHDLWQAEFDSQKKMGPQQKRGNARFWMFWMLQNDGGILKINAKHNARPDFSNNGKAVNPEAKTLEKIGEDFLKDAGQVDRLNEIARGWPGYQSGKGQVFVQVFKDPDVVKDRQFLWFTFLVLIHEYLHTLTHERYDKHANDLGGEKSSEGNTLIEGVDSLFTEIVWKNTLPKITATSDIRQEVEGKDYAKLPEFDKSVLMPDPAGGRYPSYDRAIKLVNVVGIRNLYAAYFLGQVELIGK